MASVTERRFRLGPVTLGLAAAGAAVEAFVESLEPFATQAEREAVVTFEHRIDAEGARTVPLPRFDDGALVGDGLRARLSGTTLSVSEASGSGEVANAFRWLLAERLLEHRAVLIHGVGLVAAGFASVFTGESGAGKSTLGRAAQEGGLRVLGDELVIIQDLETPHVYGTPWNTGGALDGPLALFGTLGWSKAASLISIEPTQLLRVALRNVLLPRQDPATRARVAKVLLSVIGKVRTVRLDFAPAASVATVLSAELSAR